MRGTDKLPAAVPSSGKGAVPADSNAAPPSGEAAALERFSLWTEQGGSSLWEDEEDASLLFVSTLAEEAERNGHDADAENAFPLQRGGAFRNGWRWGAAIAFSAIAAVCVIFLTAARFQGVPALEDGPSAGSGAVPESGAAEGKISTEDAASETDGAADGGISTGDGPAETTEAVNGEEAVPETAPVPEAEPEKEPESAPSLFRSDTPSYPLLPTDLYLPSDTTGETFLFEGRETPVYAGVLRRQVHTEDFVWQGDRLFYTGNKYDAVFGVDVSSYNNYDRARYDFQLDWNAAKADGVEFAIVRVGARGTSEGVLHEDDFYGQNIDGAMAAGIRTGVYIFSQAVSVEEALEEAEFVLDRIRGHEINGPVCFDWEMNDSSYRVRRVSREMATACAVAFCRRIEAEGYTPIVYQSRYVGYARYDQGALKPWLCWYSQYFKTGEKNAKPNFHYQMDIWQFSRTCSVAGIGVRIDGNLWFLPKTGEESPDMA